MQKSKVCHRSVRISFNWVTTESPPGASLVAQMVKNPPAMQETWVWSLGWEDPLQEGMATHSSILTWKIPMDTGAWQATVHEVTTSQTQLNDYQSKYNIIIDFHVMARTVDSEWTLLGALLRQQMSNVWGQQKCQWRSKLTRCPYNTQEGCFDARRICKPQASQGNLLSRMEVVPHDFGRYMCAWWYLLRQPHPGSLQGPRFFFFFFFWVAVKSLSLLLAHISEVTSIFRTLLVIRGQTLERNSTAGVEIWLIWNRSSNSGGCMWL